MGVVRAPKHSQGSEWLTPDQVAQLFQLDLDQVYTLINSGALSAIDVSREGARRRTYRIHDVDVDDFIRRRRGSTA